MERRYFIIELPNQNMSQALDICIGLNSTQRYSLDGNKLLVKTTNELINEKQKTFNIENLLNSVFCTEYTHEEILTIMNTLEWQLEDII